jgi:hypothetical protein
MKRSILSFLSALFLVGFASAQNFIRLTDASGITPTAEEISSTESAVQVAINVLPVEDRPLFKVYDVGFYIHSVVTDGGILPVWESVKSNVENDQNSEYYLIFGRESSSEGLNSKIRVKLKLPTSSNYSCLTEEERGNLEKYIEQVANDNLNFRYTLAEVAALELLKDYFHKIVICNCANIGTSCSQFSNFNFLDIQLRGLGFRKKEIQLGGASSWSSGTQDIFDYAGKNVIIDGAEYDIADQVSEGKDLIEASVQVLPDTTISTSISGKVYILDNESFTNGEWEAAKAEAASNDYVEYWVILANGNGKYFLYSKFTIGEIVPVAAKGDGIENKVIVATSPWGLALKALGNAAVDACIQAAIIRILDSSAQDWYSAWGKVSYLGAAWEGLSSLIPWKTSLASDLMQDAARSFATVLNNALTISDYSTQKGLVDFSVGMAMPGVIKLTKHSKAIGIIGQPNTNWAKIAFSKGLKRLYTNSPTPLKRVISAVQKVILGNGGNLVKTYDKYERREYAEIFYRAMPSEHFDNLKSNFKLLKSANNETSTSPNASFSQSYNGVLVKIWVEPGTIDKLKAVGVRSHPDLHPHLQQHFGNLPFIGGGWHPSKVQFKVETNEVVTPNFKQVNIQLGSGEGVKIFNDNLLYFEKIN